MTAALRELLRSLDGFLCLDGVAIESCGHVRAPLPDWRLQPWLDHRNASDVPLARVTPDVAIL
jgi:hypothetical protein